MIFRVGGAGPADDVCPRGRLAPLAPNGQPIGSLCVMDMKPRQLTEREKRLLLEYASEVMEEIAKRAPLSRRADPPAVVFEAPDTNVSPINRDLKISS